MHPQLNRCGSRTGSGDIPGCRHRLSLHRRVLGCTGVASSVFSCACKIMQCEHCISFFICISYVCDKQQDSGSSKTESRDSEPQVFTRLLQTSNGQRAFHTLFVKIKVLSEDRPHRQNHCDCVIPFACAVHEVPLPREPLP